MSPPSKLPAWPLTNMGNAEFTATNEAFVGEHTVIDFWTTKCTRCPDALDQLNELAADERYKKVKFASIVCDSCDGARNIIDKEDSPRWDKVPFYVVLDENGEIIQMGSKKQIDFDNIPGMEKPKDVEEGRKEGDAFEIMDLDF
eukprot:scaffold18506_cov60-Skeletonema_marinoi.AAC.1